MSVAILILAGILPFLKKGPTPPKPSKPSGQPTQPDTPPNSEEAEALKRRLSLYRKIIARYQSVIEKEEDKSVQQLRELVNPANPAVKKLRDQILDSFHPYIYDRDFPKAAENAYLYCKDKLANEHLPVDFWLAPEDIIEAGAADEIDKATLLCSLLIAMENPSAKVAVETQGTTRHAFVTFEFAGRFFFLDPTHAVSANGAREAVLEKYIKDREKKLIYEFNDREYREW